MVPRIPTIAAKTKFSESYRDLFGIHIHKKNNNKSRYRCQRSFFSKQPTHPSNIYPFCFNIIFQSHIKIPKQFNPHTSCILKKNTIVCFRKSLFQDSHILSAEIADSSMTIPKDKFEHISSFNPDMSARTATETSVPTFGKPEVRVTCCWCKIFAAISS